jgi:hypothetical protein
VTTEEVEYDELPPPSEEFAHVWPKLKEQNVSELVRMYRDHRDELALARKTFKQKEANVKDLLSRIEMALRDKADEMGVDSFATPDGTAFRTKKKKYRVGDWPTFCQYVKDTGYFNLFEKRVSKLAAVEVHDERMILAAEMPEDFDPVPPGLIYLEEVGMAVRKPTATRKKT